ncbi:MAG: hypothetical protein AAGE98_01365 [Actinomycetota bacterium]
MPVPILAAVRSPFAMADGVLAGWHPVDLSVVVAQAALDHAGIDAAALGHVWVGCDEPVGAQGANVARAIVLGAGWPETIGATVVEAGPHSGMSALAAAVDAIEAGRVEAAIVVGVASSSIVQPGASALARLYGRPWGDLPAARFDDEGGIVAPVVAADRAALAADIDRAAQDAWGLRSIERRTPPPGGLVTVGARPGDGVAVQKDTPVTDDAIRSIPVDDLEPVFEPDGTTTAAGYAPAADGVGVLVLGRGAEPIGEIVRVDQVATSPLAVAAITPDASADRIDLAAVSASTALAAIRLAGLDPDQVDLDGGTIATGDAAAAEDLRLVVDGLHRCEPDTSGYALRAGTGAAAGCFWRRL